MYGLEFEFERLESRIEYLEGQLEKITTKHEKPTCPGMWVRSDSIELITQEAIDADPSWWRKYRWILVDPSHPQQQNPGKTVTAATDCE